MTFQHVSISYDSTISKSFLLAYDNSETNGPIQSLYQNLLIFFFSNLTVPLLTRENNYAGVQINGLRLNNYVHTVILFIYYLFFFFLALLL